MASLKSPLLPPLHASQNSPTSAPSLFHRMDLSGLKKRGHGARSWIRIDTTGTSRIIEVDKVTLMKRCDLPARDIRLLDPLFVYPSTILGREKAIVVNLEQIRCIITADEVILHNSQNGYVMQYVGELQRRLAEVNGQGLKRPASAYSEMHNADPCASTSVSGLPQLNDRRYEDAKHLPFEFIALEIALEAACTSLDAQVRDEIEHLMDDDGDMAELYLSEKKERMEFLFQRDQSLLQYASFGAGASTSAPVSPVCSPNENVNLEKTFSRTLSCARSRQTSARSSEGDNVHIEEMEMLLEAYFVVIDGVLNKLTSLKEYIVDTEDFINIQLDHIRNHLIQFELLLTTATFVVAIYGVVAGVFGMNIEIAIFEEPRAFKWVIIITGLCGLFIFFFFLTFFKCKGWMPQ